MTFPQGIDFRSTSGFVTDPTNYTSEVGTTLNYPRTTPQGNTVGWVSGSGIQGRDRSAAVDARLAGFQFSTVVSTYEIDLPSAGSYTINLAVGDQATSQTNQKIELFDDTSSLGVLFSGLSIAGGSAADATGVVRTDAAWPGSNVAITQTFATTKLKIAVGPGAGTNGLISSIFVQAAGGPVLTPGWMGGQEQWMPPRSRPEIVAY